KSRDYMPRSFISIFRRQGAPSGLLARRSRVAVLGLAAGVAGGLLVRHADPYPVSAGVMLLAAGAASLAWLGIATWLRRTAAQPQAQPQARGPAMWLDRAAAPVQRACEDAASAPPIDAEQHQATIQVVFASQTGFAEQLARQTSQQLQRSGMAAQLRGLGALQLSDLCAARRVLFVVSTTGDGDAPD